MFTNLSKTDKERIDQLGLFLTNRMHYSTNDDACKWIAGQIFESASRDTDWDIIGYWQCLWFIIKGGRSAYANKDARKVADLAERAREHYVGFLVYQGTEATVQKELGFAAMWIVRIRRLYPDETVPRRAGDFLQDRTFNALKAWGKTIRTQFDGRQRDALQQELDDSWTTFFVDASKVDATEFKYAHTHLDKILRENNKHLKLEPIPNEQVDRRRNRVRVHPQNEDTWCAIM
jgi:hypothetical protein